MKCKHCNGTGKVRGYFYEKTGVNKWENVWGDSPCDECNGTGEIELTEQEYIQTCNTEQLAEFLSKIEEQYPCGSLLKCDVTCGYHSQCRSDDVAPTNKETWVEWLKQPHEE